jgi:hypothetical protein
VVSNALAPGVSQQAVKHPAGIWIAGALRAAARITTRGETRLTGTMKHIPRTDWVELVAPSRGAPGEGVLSSHSDCPGQVVILICGVLRRSAFPGKCMCAPSSTFSLAALAGQWLPSQFTARPAVVG